MQYIFYILFICLIDFFEYDFFRIQREETHKTVFRYDIMGVPEDFIIKIMRYSVSYYFEIDINS